MNGNVGVAVSSPVPPRSSSWNFSLRSRGRRYSEGAVQQEYALGPLKGDVQDVKPGLEDDSSRSKIVYVVGDGILDQSERLPMMGRTGRLPVMGSSAPTPTPAPALVRSPGSPPVSDSTIVTTAYAAIRTEQETNSPGGNAASEVARNRNNRRSLPVPSRPLPPAFLNNPGQSTTPKRYHRRHSSEPVAALSVQRPPWNGHNPSNTALLKSSHVQLRRPPILKHSSVSAAAARQAAEMGPSVNMTTISEHRSHNHQHPSAGPVFPAPVGVPLGPGTARRGSGNASGIASSGAGLLGGNLSGNSTTKSGAVKIITRDQDFIARTQRASARVQFVTATSTAPVQLSSPRPSHIHPLTSALKAPKMYSDTAVTESRPPPPPPARAAPARLGTSSGAAGAAVGGAAAGAGQGGPASSGVSAWEKHGANGRARRLSNSSHASNTSAVGTASSYVSSRESFDSRPRSSSFSSHTSFESTTPFNGSVYASPTAIPNSAQFQYSKTNANAYQFPWQRPPPIRPYRRKAKPGEIFAALPGEVLEMILGQLRDLHLEPGSQSCATCWMRDCTAVALSARKFLKYARVALYEDVQLVGADGANMKKKTKINHGARLALLRRTLRVSTQIAVVVRSLKVPALPMGAGVDEYHDLIASVVMACPNLERLVGFHPSYNHSFSKLFHALSTRPKMKEMNWVLESSPLQRQRKLTAAAASQLVAPGDLQPFQSAAFLEMHVNWLHLQSLTIHCLPGATLTPDTLLENTIHALPSLKNLHLSRLPHNAFNDSNLLSLPPLKKLTLAHLPGITTVGLSSFATRSSSTTLVSLTLVHIDIDSLPVIARVLANLTSLHTFQLVQASPPIMPSDEMIWLFPYLASASLHKLHWDIPEPTSRLSAADTILTKSISANGFPSLCNLRVPNDPDGVFQSLCQPRERVDTPSDRYRGGPGGLIQNLSPTDLRKSSVGDGSDIDSPLGRAGGEFARGHGHNDSMTSNRTGSVSGPSTASVAKTPTTPSSLPDGSMLRWPLVNSDLHRSRRAAQARLEAARRFPRYFVNVISPEGMLVEKYGIGAFIGSVGSKIDYDLMPDPGATDEGGGLARVQELLGDCGEDLVVKKQVAKDEKLKGGKKEVKKDMEEERREGCSGRWNVYAGPGSVSDKKDRERWWHTERGRWQGVILS